MPLTRGLVVGKFAPLHRGHELLVRRALAECDEVVVLSWANPEPAGCGAERRARWLAELFPETRRLVVTEELLHTRARGELEGWSLPPDSADDSIQQRFTGLLCRDLLGLEVDRVYTSERYGDGLAQTLTEVFSHDGAERPVFHVSVDPARAWVPISGSAIRRDVHAHREWLSPAVYASFVQRVVLLGGESSGKSTLAAALANHFGTAWVAEYGRELWEERSGGLTFEDLYCIARRQVEREEEAALRAHRDLFCDTSPLTTLFYSLDLFGRADPHLEAFAERTYDLVVLCAPDFPFVQDGTRREPGFRERQHAWYVRELTRRRIPWIDAAGPVEERIEQVATALSERTG